MQNPPAPTDKDIVTMVVNTVNYWRQQRAMHAQKVAEYDALLRKIGVGMDPEKFARLAEELPKSADAAGELHTGPGPAAASPGNNDTPPKIKISPFVSSDPTRRDQPKPQPKSAGSP